MDIINCTVYVLLFIFVGVIFMTERKDMLCPTLSATDGECDNFGGMSYSGSIPNDGDSCKESFNKLTRLYTLQYRRVKWRFIFLVSFFVSFMLWCLYFTPGYLPRWNQFIITLLLVFVVISGYYMYEDYHINKRFNKAIDNIENKIEGCLSDS